MICGEKNSFHILTISLSTQLDGEIGPEIWSEINVIFQSINQPINRFPPYTRLNSAPPTEVEGIGEEQGNQSKKSTNQSPEHSLDLLKHVRKGMKHQFYITSFFCFVQFYIVWRRISIFF